MSYLNPIFITDEHVSDVASREDLSQIYELNDKFIEAFCQSKGVLVEDIPVDGSGYANTYAVVELARLQFYFEVLRSYRGTAHGNDEDIYMSKLETYVEDLRIAQNTTTKDRILQDTPLDITSFTSFVPVY